MMDIHIIFVASTILAMKAWSCNDPSLTMSYVSACPNNLQQWNKAADRKNCSHYGFLRSCHYVYHCLINTWLNATIEVCSPAVTVLGRFCAEFNIGGKTIQANGKLSCKDTSCPFKYRSTDAYKYQSCYTRVYSTIKTTATVNPPTYSIVTSVRYVMKKDTHTYPAHASNFGAQHRIHFVGVDNPLIVITMVMLMCYG